MFGSNLRYWPRELRVLLIAMAAYVIVTLFALFLGLPFGAAMVLGVGLAMLALILLSIESRFSF